VLVLLRAERKDVEVRPLRGLDSALVGIPKAFSAAESLTLNLSERCSPTSILEATALLDKNAFYERIKHLVLAITSPQGSKSSTWPTEMPYWPVDLSGMRVGTRALPVRVSWLPRHLTQVAQ
jgi:hypothetical protein